MSFKERISNAPKSKWIRMAIVNTLCLLFVIWSGYYVLLLFALFFFDCYITKYIPWGAWRNSKNTALRKTMEWVDAIVFALVAVYFINTFFFQNYQIPTSSLEKSLLVGDFLFVSKMSYGSRAPMTPFSFPLVQHTLPILNIKSYFDKPQVDYKRLSGGGQIKRGDIVVFNFPAGDTVAVNRQAEDYYSLCVRNSAGRSGVWSNKAEYGEIVYRPVDRRENYVKRCIGLPGETIELKDDAVLIDGKEITDPENVQYAYVVQTNGTQISTAVWDELEISKDDQRYIGGSIPADYHLIDSTLVADLGLNWNNGKTGLLYQVVFLTNDKLAKLKEKNFVLSVIRLNAFAKYLTQLGILPKSNELTYPITYNANNYAGDFPALWIPKKGATINFDENVDYKVAAYHRCIRNYEHNDFDYRDGIVYINGKQADSYTFKYDYFFMMGDNRNNSADSRSWGFVPEDHIVGKPIMIWLSLDKDKGWFSGKIRWNRLFTSATK